MNKYFEQNLKLVDYIDGMMIVDRDCIIRYYYTASDLIPAHIFTP